MNKKIHVFEFFFLTTHDAGVILTDVRFKKLNEREEDIEMVEFDYSALRGKIVEKFGSQREFAAALGLSERSLSLKLNNRVYFTQDEMSKAAVLLDVKLGKLKELFFTPKVQKIEHSGA